MEHLSNRILIAIPAHNEEPMIGTVVQRVRQSLSKFDLLVVNDGSSDTTGKILRNLNVVTATHLCNLGYGRAIQTAIKYALNNEYSTLITMDADGQHSPEQIHAMLDEFINGNCDVLIGSRYIRTQDYSEAPLGRRIGMKFFSILSRLVTGKRIYDTTSGLKIIRHSVFEPLTQWHFIDFHAEAIVYLLRLGYRICEYPITVGEREHGQSMYSIVSYFSYPLKTSLMVFLGAIQANLTRINKQK